MSPTADRAGPPSETTVLGYLETLSNWGRWGAEDERGALNLVTASKSAEAAALVQSGVVVPCGRLIEFGTRPDRGEAPVPPQHFMQASGQGISAVGSATAFDWVNLPLHGLYLTHLDAPSHVFWNGTMYNGFPADTVTTTQGARRCGVDAAGPIVTRGVLLDIPAVRGVPWLEAGDAVTDTDLRAAEEAAGVRVQEGDVVLVRTGYGARRPRANAMPGVGAGCLPFFWERMPAMLGTDVGTDVYPSGYDALPAPVHAVALVAMGMWIMDNCDLEALARTATDLGRWDFMLTVPPLRLKNCTSSPVNPIAIF